MDIRYTLDIQVYVSDLLLHRTADNYLFDHVICAEIYCCFTFVSCPMDIQFIGHSLHVGPTHVKLYSVNVVRIVIEYGKRSKSVLLSFHVQWTFVLRWIFGFMFLIRSYTGLLMITCLTM